MKQGKDIRYDAQHKTTGSAAVLSPTMERSLLAESFVPAVDRAMNERQATVILQPQEGLPTLVDECNRVRAQLCPSIPLSPVHGSEFKRPVLGSQPTGTPESIILPARCLPPDLYFAVEHRQSQLMSPSNGMKASKERKIPLVENISDLESYCETFEALLMEERKEVLICYERYTQYKHSMEIPNINAKSISSSSRCWVNIEGITDARPPVQVGDILLVRPDSLVWLPHPSIATVLLPQPQVLEVQLQCTAISRHPSGKDRLQATWLEASQARLFHSAHNLSPVFNVRLVPNPKLLVRCFSAISWLSTLPSTLAMELLYPTKAPTVPTLSPQVHLLFTKELNENQASFVRCLWQRTQHPSYREVRGPLVLTGPAGTGKTKALLCAIRQILSLNVQAQTQTQSEKQTSKQQPQTMRILVCTPSHTAADVVTQRLGQHLSREQLFRLYDADRPVAYAPLAVLPYCRQNESSGTFVLPSVEDLLKYEVIVCTCLDAHLLYLAGMTNQQLRHHRQYLERQTVESFAKCGIKVNSIPGVNDTHFTHLFIDEAAQAIEPETLIALSVTVDPHPQEVSRKVEIALVGDPRQLSPEVYSPKAARCGLNRSWIERLLRTPNMCLGGGNEDMLGPKMIMMDEFLRYSFQRDGQEQLSSFLTLNYRGHPSFLAMPSALFYSDKLHSAIYDKTLKDKKGELFWCERLRNIEGLSSPIIPPPSMDLAELEEALRPCKQFNFPIHYRGVIGKDVSVTIKSGFTSDSWKNHDEAAVVVEIVETLTSNGVGSQSIGVMAPFRGQVVLIRRLLRAKNLAAINVGTIEDYQGVERDVVILSLTRSTKAFVSHDIDRRIGVFGQPKRSNVALTRAENLLIVVGNPEIMKGDLLWEQWLWFCLRNGVWYGDSGGGGDSPPLQNAENLKFVRYFPDIYSKASSAMEGNAEQVITVSSLERMLRTTL